ncbi:Z1 domain-containing protein [Burkholderia gladioli]|uniref:Z1 domain-containing protein n=1 Tax=Burkholderia gladioli TaxID=28095 RepID=UPI00164124D1|nr:Z1 domain-containing protein [Burkholderia gladioli]
MTLNDLENNAIGVLATMPDRTSESVRMVLKTLLMLSPGLKAQTSAEQLELCAQRIETKLFVRVNDASSIKLDGEFKPWLPQRRAEADSHFYYPRYRRWLSQKGFVSTVLGVLDKDTDKIVGLLGDPLLATPWSRRGLVVGHVQSGKTANYSGVISKAADYGYKFIVVLAGTQEDLRAQTQERIEEGFIGSNSDKVAKDPIVGVGRLGLDRRPSTLTSRADDFKVMHARLTMPIQSLKEPLILVMKKNARVLANLVEWLKTKNKDPSGRISGTPMLLIDDEADNASVNTSANADSPTSINGRIRELLSLFDKNVYLGYTATPFANIFIDPESQDAMAREDLFPRDFIVSLDAPTNYVSAARLFGADGDLGSSLITVDDHEASLPEKHKISWKVPALPPSLKEAVATFLLARAIRCCRGNGTNHSSMLINVSRFNDVQTQVTGLVKSELVRYLEACQGHAALSEAQALRDPALAELRRVWDDQFEGNVTETWSDVQRRLREAVGPVEVRTINGKSPDTLDYKRNEETGLHVIAIGGFVLSRGFTLEGLTVSYFLRSSMMYDTLLQMGRWFGYRDGYTDVCRVYMTDDAIGWYSHISGAIDELRDEFKRMERAKRTPREFGLRVRSDPEALIITARNKMRTGKPVRHSISLGSTLIETTSLRKDALDQNRDLAEEFVAALDRQHGTKVVDSGWLWSGVSAAEVRGFVGRFRNYDDLCIKTQSEPVNAYIQAREGDEMPKWDVCLFSPAKAEAGDYPLGARRVRLQARASSWDTADDGVEYFRINGKSSRVASRGQEQVGLSDTEIKQARHDFAELPGNKGKNVPDYAYRLARTRPLLMLHLLLLREGETGVREERGALAWGISFKPTDRPELHVEYVVNTTWWKSNFQDDLEEAAEELESVDA